MGFNVAIILSCVGSEKYFVHDVWFMFGVGHWEDPIFSPALYIERGISHMYTFKNIMGSRKVASFLSWVLLVPLLESVLRQAAGAISISAGSALGTVSPRGPLPPAISLYPDTCGCGPSPSPETCGCGPSPSPPPPPPACPPPPPPPPPSCLDKEYENTRQCQILLQSTRVIQKFKKTIVKDPKGYTKTWTGVVCEDNSKYKGFICDRTISDKTLRVALVSFNGLRFEGNASNPLSLDNILDELPDPIVFHANSNFFSGCVPPIANKVTNLLELDLSNNRISGTFPTTVLEAKNLTFLDLRFNRLTGTVPPGVFNLEVDVLFLNNNQFEGQIPDCLGQTPALYLTFANNFFTGRIPSSIGDASKTLLEILLLNNTLSGCLPHEIGKLSKVTLFDASINKLTGPLPYSLGCLTNLQYFNISCNQFYGEVPEYLCKLKDLVAVTLNNNYFTQVGPECRKLIEKKILDVSMNCIRDLPGQRSEEECRQFFMKRQSCPDPNSMKMLPCKLPLSASLEKPAPGSRKLMTVPRTYAALQP